LPDNVRTYASVNLYPEPFNSTAATRPKRGWPWDVAGPAFLCQRFEVDLQYELGIFVNLRPLLFREAMAITRRNHRPCRCIQCTEFDVSTNPKVCRFYIYMSICKYVCMYVCCVLTQSTYRTGTWTPCYPSSQTASDIRRQEAVTFPDCASDGEQNLGSGLCDGEKSSDKGG
jgi:hypothetical protein